MAQLNNESDEFSNLKDELKIVTDAIDAPNRPFVKNYNKKPVAESSK